MKTCLFLPARNSSRVRSIYTRFSATCSMNIELFNDICYIRSIRYAFIAMLRQNRSHFPLNRVHLLHKMAGKVAPDVTSKLISVNCITQCVT